jgi:glucose-6-phosphate isomerase
MKLRKNKLHPLSLDLGAARIDPVTMARWSEVRDEWREVLQVDAGMRGGPEELQSSIPGGWVRGPEELLHEYLTNRQRSVLGAIFKQANRMHEQTDQVVVIGTRDACCGARAIVEACCQPYWNELSRAERGSKPRIYFLDDPADNDQLQGLLYLLRGRVDRSGSGCHLPWGVVVLDPTSDDAGVRFAQQTMQRALSDLLEGCETTVADCIVSIALATRPNGNADASHGNDCQGTVPIVVPVDWPWSHSALSPAGLLPAALVGINVIELLQGASWMTQHAMSAAAEENLVMRLLVVRPTRQLSERPRTRMLIAWQSCLMGLCHWAEHMAQVECSPVDYAEWRRVASGIDQSNAQLVRSASSVDCVEHVCVDSVRFDPLEFTDAELLQSLPDTVKWLPDVIRSKWAECEARLEAVGTPSVSMRLAAADELHIGQWMQWMMLCAQWERWMAED